MTNHWSDIANANLVLVMGGNAAEAHPCGFKWVTEAKAHNKARLIVVDPLVVGGIHRELVAPRLQRDRRRLTRVRRHHRVGLAVDLRAERLDPRSVEERHRLARAI